MANMRTGKLKQGLYEEIIVHGDSMIDDIRSYVELLCGHKISLAGKGEYASVYHKKPSATVLKIGKVDENAGALAFLKLARANQDNPFFPQVHHGWLFANEAGEQYFMFEIERLQKGWRYVDTRRFLPKWWRVVQYLGTCIDEFDDIDHMPGFMGMYSPPTLKEALGKIIKIQKKESLEWDLHSGNVMMRSDGQAVITDPFY